MLSRNWAYWTTFCQVRPRAVPPYTFVTFSLQDTLWSLYIGRDCALAAPIAGQMVPVPFVDSEFDHEPWVWEPSGLPPQKSNIASVLQATCELLRIGRRVMDFV